MRNKKNTRTCKGCRLKKDKKEFIRIYFKDSLQFTEKENIKTIGRGMYICKSKECLEKMLKKNNIKKCLRLTNENISDEDIKSLREYINKIYN